MFAVCVALVLILCCIDLSHEDPHFGHYGHLVILFAKHTVHDDLLEEEVA